MNTFIDFTGRYQVDHKYGHRQKWNPKVHKETFTANVHMKMYILDLPQFVRIRFKTAYWT